MKTVLLDQPKVKLVAHRGLSGLECENTCAAFVAAGNHSYHGIESDVHCTADGFYVMIHDNRTDRVSPWDRLVEESTLDDLSSIRLYDPQSGTPPLTRRDLGIPTLEEYIRICRFYQKTSFLELKHPLTEQQIAEIIRIVEKMGHLDNTVFISFHFEYLVTVRQILPHQPIQFLTGEWRREFLEQLAQYHFGLDIAVGALTRELVEQLHQKGLPVNCWTCDDLDTARTVIDWGVDYITTDILE